VESVAPALNCQHLLLVSEHLLPEQCIAAMACHAVASLPVVEIIAASMYAILPSDNADLLPGPNMSEAIVSDSPRRHAW
jgi:hypothetical protein